MVKKLGDICLGCIQNKLDTMPHVARALPTVYKETLLERLASHDMFYPHFLPHITYNLFVPSLTTVQFDECSQLSDDILKQLAKCGCQLKHLVVSASPNVTDIGIQAITKDQNELTVLELKKLQSLSHKGLICLKSKKLIKIKLKDCVALTTEGVVTAVTNNPTLKVLILRGCCKLDDKVFQPVAMALGANLEELDTGINVMSDDSVEALAEFCPNLLRLSLYGCTRIGGTALIRLSQGCTKLQTLDLSYCNLLRKSPNAECLWTLPTMLTDLSLCGILLEDEGIFVECLQRLKHLKYIQLCGVPALNDSSFTKILQHIGHNLICIDVSGGILKKLTDAGLAAVSKYCTRLEGLMLTFQVNITGTTLMPLLEDQKRANMIRKVHLSCRNLDPNVLYQVVSCCHGLELLEVSGLACVTDEILMALGENCPRLTHLGMKGCRQVTDVGICEVARHCSLRSLVIAGLNNLTDKSVFALANSCHYLDEIFLNGCAYISPAAVRYLQDCCIPRLWAHHATPNAVHDQLMAKNLDTGEFCRADLLVTSR